MKPGKFLKRFMWWSAVMFFLGWCFTYGFAFDINFDWWVNVFHGVGLAFIFFAVWILVNFFPYANYQVKIENVNRLRKKFYHEQCVKYILEDDVEKANYFYHQITDIYDRRYLIGLSQGKWYKPKTENNETELTGND